MKKRNRKMRREPANNLYLENLLANSRPPPEQDVTRLMNDVRTMYQRVRDGVGDEVDVIRLGVVINTGCTRGRTIGQPLVDAFQLAGEALLRCEERSKRTGHTGFDGPGLLAMNAAMDLYQELLTLSSVQQMADAETAARRWMARAAAAQGEGATT